MNKSEFIKLLRKIWWFIWEDDSFLSWVVNIVLSFILIKFLVYPVLGIVLGTPVPIVAVVSGSMEHDSSFSTFWNAQQGIYDGFNITSDDFSKYPFNNGFNKGDIMLLVGKNPEKIEKGDVIVFKSGRPDPIIHRVVDKTDVNGTIIFQTKGDHNTYQITDLWLDEKEVSGQSLMGEAVLRIPFLGWVKILFVNLLNAVRAP